MVKRILQLSFLVERSIERSDCIEMQVPHSVLTDRWNTFRTGSPSLRVVLLALRDHVNDSPRKTGRIMQVTA